MIKIIGTIIAVYLLYYAGNIVYDLFLKKDNSGRQDETEEYSLTEFSERDSTAVQKIGIDDVENINTPNSFNKKDLYSNRQDEQDGTRDLEHVRKKFESEEDIDDFSTVQGIEEKTVEINKKETTNFDSIQTQDDQHKENKETNSPDRNSYQKQFKNFLNLAETNVQVLSNRDGYKVYQSMI